MPLYTVVVRYTGVASETLQIEAPTVDQALDLAQEQRKGPPFFEAEWDFDTADVVDTEQPPGDALTLTPEEPC